MPLTRMFLIVTDTGHIFMCKDHVYFLSISMPVFLLVCSSCVLFIGKRFCRQGKLTICDSIGKRRITRCFRLHYKGQKVEEWGGEMSQATHGSWPRQQQTWLYIHTCGNHDSKPKGLVIKAMSHSFCHPNGSRSSKCFTF